MISSTFLNQEGIIMDYLYLISKRGNKFHGVSQVGDYAQIAASWGRKGKKTPGQICGGDKSFQQTLYQNFF